MKNPNAVTEMEDATLRRPTNFETIRQRAVYQCGSRVWLAALALLASGCFTFLPLARAISPPPDGCYPGLTTAEGCNALFSLAGGKGNTAIGHDALFSDTTGSWNTGVGAVALGFNNGDFNTAVGTAALFLNTAGANNTADGAFALLHNDTGGGNTATGSNALFSNIGGGGNTADGDHALYSNLSGGGNSAQGDHALYSNISGANNTANGAFALYTNTGNSNTATGYNVLYHNGDGGGNTAAGGYALFNNDTGNSNTAIGFNALVSNTTGSSSVAIGFSAGDNVITANNVICIGASGANIDNSCYVGNIFGQPGGSQAVFVNADGKLGAQVSSRRFKEEIEPIDDASEAIFSLKPVSFRYKKEIDRAGTPQFGLVAEDVEKVNPDLVIHDKNGKPYTVRYDQVNAMLLNEFLKEHKKVRQLEATVTAQEKRFAHQEKRIAALAAGLQRVNTQVEMSKPVPNMMVNNP